MLYISRFVSSKKYGVIDTDDGVEAIATIEELEDAVLKCGVEIKGVTPGRADRIGINKGRNWIEKVEVWQPVDTMTRAQTKLNILSGVDIKVAGDKIAAIVIKDVNMAKGRTLRLSDFGSSCGDYLLRNSVRTANSVVTIVLDDKIAITGKALDDFRYHGVVVDLTSVTRKKTVEFVYKQLMATSQSLVVWSDKVIDSRERSDYYKAIAVLNRMYNDMPQITSVGDIVYDQDIISEKITARFKQEFLEFVEGPMVSKRIHFPENSATVRFAQWAYQKENKQLLDCGYFDVIRLSRYIEVFEMLREATHMRSTVLLRFENYIKYFTVDEEVQQAFIRLCKRACPWIFVHIGFDKRQRRP